MSRVFVSYAWDHNRSWVLTLARRLREDGVDVVLDLWETVPGDQLPAFMESAVRESHYVLIVCTPRYKMKSDARQGGVGYEGDVMTAEIFALERRRKFVPLLREGAWTQASPSWLLGAYYLDLRGQPYAEEAYEELRDLLTGNRDPKPVLGDVKPTWAELAPIEVVRVPLPNAQAKGWLYLLLNALLESFSGAALTRFTLLVSTNVVEHEGNHYSVISVVAPYARFLRCFRDQYRSLTEDALVGRNRESWDQKILETLKDWRTDLNIGPLSAYWMAHSVIMDSELKTVEIEPSKLDKASKAFWRPRTTSDLLALISHMSAPATYVQVDGLHEDPRLQDLLLDVMDSGSVNLERLKVSSSNPEQWVYSGAESE